MLLDAAPERGAAVTVTLRKCSGLCLCAASPLPGCHPGRTSGRATPRGKKILPSATQKGHQKESGGAADGGSVAPVGGVGATRRRRSARGAPPRKASRRRARGRCTPLPAPAAAMAMASACAAAAAPAARGAARAQDVARAGGARRARRPRARRGVLRQGRGDRGRYEVRHPHGAAARVVAGRVGERLPSGLGPVALPRRATGNIWNKVRKAVAFSKGDAAEDKSALVKEVDKRPVVPTERPRESWLAASASASPVGPRPGGRRAGRPATSGTGCARRSAPGRGRARLSAPGRRARAQSARAGVCLARLWISVLYATS